MILAQYTLTFKWFHIEVSAIWENFISMMAVIMKHLQIEIITSMFCLTICVTVMILCDFPHAILTIKRNIFGRCFGSIPRIMILKLNMKLNFFIENEC